MLPSTVIRLGFVLHNCVVNNVFKQFKRTYKLLLQLSVNMVRENWKIDLRNKIEQVW